MKLRIDSCSLAVPVALMLAIVAPACGDDSSSDDTGAGTTGEQPLTTGAETGLPTATGSSTSGVPGSSSGTTMAVDTTGSDSGSGSEGGSETTGGEEVCEDGEWDYERGICGPKEWEAKCGVGKGQSPIDLEAGEGEPPLPMSELIFDWTETEIDVENNGHTIQYTVDEGSFVEYDGTRYDLLQFHFHASSEHTVDGAPHAMEMHMVHQSSAADGGDYLVVGIFIDAGDGVGFQDDVFDSMHWDSIPAEKAGMHESADIVALDGDFLDMVFAGDGVSEYVTGWRYGGSFTTPPCTEGILWFVFESPVQLSASYIEAFTDLYDHNYRPTQPLNGRVPEWSLR